MEIKGIEPLASCMQSTRSTPELNPLFSAAGIEPAANRFHLFYNYSLSLYQLSYAECFFVCRTGFEPACVTALAPKANPLDLSGTCTEVDRTP